MSFENKLAANSTEQREELPKRFDDPLWWPKDVEALHTEFGRLVLRARRRMTFDVGYCDPDHPLQTYVSKLAGLLPQLKDCRVLAAPYDPTANACAFADGTFFITPKLVKQAQAPEATLGILLHEWTHFQRKHTEARYEKAKKVQGKERAGESVMTSVMEGMSAGRAHEFIADLQGAIIELDKLGFNALAYKQFLEEMARREGRGSGGSVHGSTHERGLNITELLATIHLPNTNRPLMPLDERVAGWADERRGTHGFPALHERSFEMKAPAAKELLERQLAEARRVPVCLLPEALQAMWERFHEVPIARAIRAGKRMLHDCAFPPMNLLAGRLAERLSVHDAYRKEPLAVGLAVSAVYAARTVLPEQATQDCWYYMRRELEFMGFMGTGVNAALDTMQSLTSGSGEEGLGLVRQKSDLKDACAHWLVSKFPTVPQTDEACAAWWDAVTPMVRTSVQMLQDAPQTGEVSTGYREAAHHIFDEWAISVAVPKEVSSLIRDHVFAGSQRVIALRRRLFAHPRAVALLGQEEVIDPESDVLMKIQKKTGEKDYFFREGYTQEAFDGFTENVCDLFRQFKTFQGVLKGIEALSRNEEETVFRLMDFSIIRTVVLTHPAFEGFSTVAKQLVLYAKARMGVSALSKNYENIIHFRRHEGFDDTLPLSGDRDSKNLNVSLVLKIVREVEEAMAAQDEIVNLDEAGLIEVLQLTQHLTGTIEDGDRFKIHCFVAFLSKAPSVRELVRLLHEPRIVALLPIRWKESGRIGPVLNRVAEALASGEMETISFEERVGLGSLLQDASIRAEYSDWLAQSPIFKQRSFVEKVTAVIGTGEQDPELPGIAVAKELAEHEPITQRDYRAVVSTLERKVEYIEQKGMLSHGMAIFAEKILPALSADELLEFMQAAILTKEDDSRLRTFLLRQAWRNMQILEIQLADDAHVEETLTEDVTGEVRTSERNANRAYLGGAVVRMANSLLEALYRSKDVGRHLLLRKILGGPNGLLRDHVSKAKVVKALREQWIKKGEDSTLTKVIERVETSLMDDDEWETIYLGLVALLRDESFRRGPASAQTSWSQVPHLETLQKDLEIQLDVNDLDAWQVPSSVGMQRPWDYDQNWMWYAEGKLLEAIRSKTGQGEVKEVGEHTPLGFVKATVSYSSALAVRGLQSAGQVANLTVAEERDLADVYDRVEGQSRFVMLHYLERVWPDFWKVYRTIGARIGGGSLFTVVRATTHEGEERVLKTLNPNVAYHLDRAKGLYLRSADRLAKAHGGAYRLLPGLIEDVADSLYREIDFRGFIEKDAAFRERWNQFSDEGGRYRLRVPRSFGPERPECIQEEFVEAKNFTRWSELKKDKHDVKALVRLLAVSYVGQLLQGQALSDIHPGNEAVTTDNELVLFDRTLYLDLSASDQSLMQSLFMDPSESGRARALEEYFTTVLGREMPADVTRAIKKASRSLDVRTSQTLLQSLREADLRPPSNFVLVVKNLRSIDGMAKKAGWRGMIEAVNA